MNRGYGVKGRGRIGPKLVTSGLAKAAEFPSAEDPRAELNTEKRSSDANCTHTSLPPDLAEIEVQRVLHWQSTQQDHGTTRLTCTELGESVRMKYLCNEAWLGYERVVQALFR